ncbi:MAG: hypothetical protein Q8O30_13035, partial [Candidatus Omnitrophota bacterium]|nr:hypothetical protein [Candidatus Omnitrophota bacterium]
KLFLIFANDTSFLPLKVKPPSMSTLFFQVRQHVEKIIVRIEPHTQRYVDQLICAVYLLFNR